MIQNNTRPIQDLPFVNISGPICQEGYSYKEIIPCLRIKQKSLYVENTDDADGDDADDSDSSSLIVADDHGTFSSWDPQYELNTTNTGGIGQPYTSILNLRSDKIQNILSISNWDWISDLVTIQYEDLLKYGTSEHLIQKIELSTGVTSSCIASPPAPQRLNKTKLRSNYIEFINTYYEHWDIEELIGYYPIIEPIN